MHKLEIIRYQTAYLFDRVLHVFDKAILLIPPDQMDFRPAPTSMTARELALHVYQVIHLLVRATETGSYNVCDLALIPFNPDHVQHPSEIVAYGGQVKAYARAAMEALDEAHLDRNIHHGPRRTGFDTMMLVFEEAIHHRGQLLTYLRILNVKPPRLYEYA